MQTSAETKLAGLRVEKTTGLLRRIPIAIGLIAILAALLHIAPYWRAQSQTPPGWTFIGNLSVSPDMMQYRAWMRHTEESGILIANRFTTEPNNSHLPVALYYAVGEIARWTGFSPEWVYAYAGSLFVFLFTILLFVIVRQFLKSSYQQWWVFLAILLGGGLGAHLKLLSTFEVVRNNFLLRRTLVEGLWAQRVFEDQRWAYVIISQFETHAMLLWLLVTAAVVSLYFTLRQFSWWRMSLTVSLYAAATLLHLYQGVTLLVITAAVVFVFWLKGLEVRFGLITLLVSTLVVAICIIWQVLLYRSSGLPLPSWRAPNILFSTLLIGYPLAWGLIAWGITDYWRQAGLKECFLLGWALGCTALTLSGPFYPYPDRGLLTLQIPIYVVAGAIYFSRFKRVTPLAALVAILILGATPAWALKEHWEHTGFAPGKPYMFMSAEHREMVDLLQNRAGENDVLIVDKSTADWMTDDLWLAPEYPGKLYAGHFFLTVDYDRKRAEVNRFFAELAPDEQAAFLREKGIRFVYVAAEQDPVRFERVPGLVLVRAASIGSLFEYTGAVAHAR